MTVLTTDQTIRLGFAKLRQLTDPRGHSLLDVLEAYMLDLQDASQEIQALALPRDSNVVQLDTHSMRA